MISNPEFPLLLYNGSKMIRHIVPSFLIGGPLYTPSLKDIRKDSQSAEMVVHGEGGGLDCKYGGVCVGGAVL